MEVTVGANAADNKPVDKDAWPELPMPRDSHMLPEHSQQLLRAARSGRLFKPPAPPDDDNEMKDEEERRLAYEGWAHHRRGRPGPSR